MACREACSTENCKQIWLLNHIPTHLNSELQHFVAECKSEINVKVTIIIIV